MGHDRRGDLRERGADRDDGQADDEFGNAEMPGNEHGAVDQPFGAEDKGGQSGDDEPKHFAQAEKSRLFVVPGSEFLLILRNDLRLLAAAAADEIDGIDHDQRREKNAVDAAEAPIDRERPEEQ